MKMCGFALIVPLFLSGQIVIDYNEIPHTINTRWTKNGADDQDAKLPAGIYFYNLKTSGQTAIGKVILVK